jgi:hypothetical protein
MHQLISRIIINDAYFNKKKQHISHKPNFKTFFLFFQDMSSRDTNKKMLLSYIQYK